MVSECRSSGARNLTADLGCENLHKQPSQDRKRFILRRHRLRNLHTLCSHVSKAVRLNTHLNTSYPIRDYNTSDHATPECRRRKGVVRGIYKALRPPLSSSSLRTSFVFRLWSNASVYLLTHFHFRNLHASCSQDEKPSQIIFYRCENLHT